MHIEAFGLTPRTSFTTFVTQHGKRPFGFSWYQGEIETDDNGRGIADFTGIFSEETFLLGDSPVQMDHLGIWFADPNDAVRAGCPGIVTFDGDHEAAILVLSTGNFPDVMDLSSSPGRRHLGPPKRNQRMSLSRFGICLGFIGRMAGARARMAGRQSQRFDALLRKPGLFRGRAQPRATFDCKSITVSLRLSSAVRQRAT
jgi:hypothetical protein